MKMLRNCQAFDSEGYRTNKQTLPLDVYNGRLINPEHYNADVIITRDNFISSEFACTAEVHMRGALWDLFVDSRKLHEKAEALGAVILIN